MKLRGRIECTSTNLIL